MKPRIIVGGSHLERLKARKNVIDAIADLAVLATATRFGEVKLESRALPGASSRFAAPAADESQSSRAGPGTRDLRRDSSEV